MGVHIRLPDLIRSDFAGGIKNDVAFIGSACSINKILRERFS